MNSEQKGLFEKYQPVNILILSTYNIFSERKNLEEIQNVTAIEYKTNLKRI